MELQRSTYVIRREDAAIDDATTLYTEGLLIGSLPQCDLFLNHKSVARSHAGIQQLDGEFYIFPLSQTTATTLNEVLVEERRALASGDRVQIGSFVLNIDCLSRDTLGIVVRLNVALHIGETGARGVKDLTQKSGSQNIAQAATQATEAAKTPSDSVALPSTASQASNQAPDAKTFDTALGVFWEKRKREAGKIARPTLLHPKGEKRLGKARYNWTPTTDLAPNRYGGTFLFASIVIAALSVAAAFSYMNAFSPAPVSNPHTRAQFAFSPSVARTPNAALCTNCHSLNAAFTLNSTAAINANCALCHTTKIFQSSITRAHREAGIGCTACHTEHQGAEFSLRTASLASCTICHNDANRNTYNGKPVFTAHRTTKFGYPVENNEWIWKGIEAEELAFKDASVRAAIERKPDESERQFLVKQFHALHLYRVRTVEGIGGNANGEMSCSSCHKSFQPIDVKTPRETCALCHNGKVDALTKAKLISETQANCTSCHVQHAADKRHWNPSLMSENQNITRQTLALNEPVNLTAHGKP